MSRISAAKILCFGALLVAVCSDAPRQSTLLVDAPGEPRGQQAVVRSDAVSPRTVDEGVRRESMPPEQIVEIVRKYSKRYALDWRLVLSVIVGESRFQTDARSNRGAFGLMQLMPTTGKSIATTLGLDSVEAPRDNIAAGIYYLWRLSLLFDGAVGMDRAKLMIAAYNAGPGRVLDAQDVVRYLGEDPANWESVRGSLPLLAPQFSTLHQYVWGTPRPRNGFFKNGDGTADYVERVARTYEEYLSKFPL